MRQEFPEKMVIQDLQVHKVHLAILEDPGHVVEREHLV